MPEAPSTPETTGTANQVEDSTDTSETVRPRPKIMAPLSPLTYYRRNITRTLPVGGAITISVFLIAAIVTLLSSVDESITSNYGFVRHFSLLGTQMVKDVPPALVTKVEKNPYLGQSIPTVVYLRSIRTVFGDMPIPVYGVDPAEMATLAKVTGNRLSKGSRWPEDGMPEMVLSRSWANNFGKKVGDKITNPDDGLPTLRPAQRLVGILEGGENLALTSRNYLILELPEPVVRTNYILIPKSPGEFGSLNASIGGVLAAPEKNGFKADDLANVKLYTFTDLVNKVRKGLGFLYKFLAIADGLVIFTVALLSGFLANIYFEQRLGEFGLLSALGFRRERLARRLVVEIGSLIFGGWLLGIGLTWAAISILDATYMRPQGLILADMNSLAVLYTLPTPFIVSLSSLATVLIRLYRFDPIEIMERR